MNITQSARIRLVAAVAACGLSVFLPRFTAEAGAARDDIKLTGCLIRADNGAGYLLTNAPGDPSIIAKDDDHKVSPSAVGTTGGFATVFYWLYGNNGLNEHVGQRVEVEGDVQGDIRDGEIKTHRKDHWTDVEVKSSGRELKARVPNGSFAFASGRDKEKGGILVRRVNVDHVKMVGAGCE